VVNEPVRKVRASQRNVGHIGLPWRGRQLKSWLVAAFQTLLGLGTVHSPTTYEQITRRNQAAA
jgi:hypothetical protein